MAPTAPKTYWNGEPADCAVVRVIVGRPMRPTWWCAGIEGTERTAVRVRYEGSTFYLDNEDGSGWAKVTEGHGSPRWRHRSLPVERELALGETCAHCSRPIITARGSNGTPFVLDAEPNPAGNVVLNEDGIAQLFMPGMNTAGQPVHTSHHVTCPRAQQIRGAERHKWRKPWR